MANSGSKGRALEYVRVRDCMHLGILSCAADAPLSEVAAIMAKHHVHAVAVANRTGGRPIGVVSDVDVVAAAARGAEPTALEGAATDAHEISADRSMARAAQLMAEHGVTHLVVLDAASGYPIGVLSSLDVAAVYAAPADETPA
jgi:CBS domain-containing protein